MVVPVSQLVLPVGVTGLTVNGKTPTPAPGSIVGIAAAGFKERHENTHKVTFGSENTVQRHTQTHRGWNQCSWHAHGFIFLFWSTPGSWPRNSVIWCTTKSGSGGQTLTPAPSRILIVKTLTVERPDWQNCKVAAKAGKRARLQSRIHRERKHHRCTFIKA